jgi:hypothetical protein
MWRYLLPCKMCHLSTGDGVCRLGVLSYGICAVQVHCNKHSLIFVITPR